MQKAQSNSAKPSSKAAPARRPARKRKRLAKSAYTNDELNEIFRRLSILRPEPKGELEHGCRGQGHMCFAASAAELDAIRQTMIDAGVTIEADFQWPGGARSIYVRDPAGNSIEFAEPRLWGFDVPTEDQS